MKKITAIVVTLIIPLISMAANCPNGLTSCHKKAIFSRDIGKANASEQDRELNNIFVPNHHDFGVYEFDNVNITGLSCCGLIADDFSGAILGAAEYILWAGTRDVGWVGGEVKATGGSKGAIDSSDDITELEYIFTIPAINELMGAMDYHLVKFNCIHFAADMHN